MWSLNTLSRWHYPKKLLQASVLNGKKTFETAKYSNNLHTTTKNVNDKSQPKARNAHQWLYEISLYWNARFHLAIKKDSLRSLIPDSSYSSCPYKTIKCPKESKGKVVQTYMIWNSCSRGLSNIIFGNNCCSRRNRRGVTRSFSCHFDHRWYWTHVHKIFLKNDIFPKGFTHYIDRAITIWNLEHSMTLVSEKSIGNIITGIWRL